VHRLLIERSAERDLKALEREIRTRVVEAIRALADNPYPRGCRKLEGSTAYYRIRVGRYRIVYEVDKSARAVTIMRIRHRRDVYR
jgi:mRNA interferase RelE/StbE